MNENQKYQIVEKIIQTDDDLLLKEVQALLGLSGDFWTELPGEVKSNVNVAKTQLDKGEGIDHDKVVKEVQDRFLK